MSRSDHSAELKRVVTNTLIVANIPRSVAFYRDVLGATVLREGEPTFLRLGNTLRTTLSSQFHLSGISGL
jgi:catechol 2,3-dioxygenase-like lactoylglutathione lyase family enzyme